MSFRWLTAHEGNLAAPTTAFVGRAEVCARMARAIGQTRLVTACGGGGMGKTRIALHVARQLRADFPDGVWMVELSGLEDPDVLPSAVINAFGLADVSARDEAEVLGEHLANRHLLLILDTCERLPQPIGTLISALLRAAPMLHVLTTSRVPLGLEDEYVIHVGPMQVTDADAPDMAGETVEGLELFFRRARQAAQFEAHPHHLALAQEVCQKLEGIPLALELAAAGLRHLSLAQILEQINETRALHANATLEGLPQRHRTLYAAIGWSHQLCEPTERLLWARLSVFAGDFDEDAVQQVCSDAQITDTPALLDSLVRKSILTRDDAHNRRYRMLDTLREYGAMWLAELGETERLRRRHRDHYLTLARCGEAAWSGSGQVHWYLRMRDELPNIRAALEWSLSHPEEIHHGLELAGALWFLWVACGFSAEGRHHLRRALTINTTPSTTRCKALWMEAYLANAQGDLTRATSTATTCRDEAIAIGYPEGVVVATKMLGTAAFLGGDLQGAGRYLGQALEYLRGDPTYLNPGLLPAIVELALVIIMQGQPQQALGLLSECLEHCHANGELWLRSYALYVQALAFRALDRIQDAITSLHASLKIKRHFHDVLGIVLCLEALSQLVVRAGYPASAAAVLQGAAEVSWREYGLPMMGSPRFADEHAQCAQQVQEMIGEQRYKQAFAHGLSLSLPDAIGFALGEGGAPGLAMDVLDLIAAGS
ncbi:MULTISPECIES: ATPase [unclassified Nonomuraea]|uniref:ATP-binding protein n=1 Tax=unclassified Nonomuraea TaxID=2593643 RepID=UPI0033E36A18